MASIPQTWAKDAESGAGIPGHQMTAGDSRPYADTDRFGKSQLGDTKPIQSPQNKVSDPVWGVNDYAGGSNSPETPEIPVTKGE
jgi:hypothetical protein